jgi:hypothetical protein
VSFEPPLYVLSGPSPGKVVRPACDEEEGMGNDWKYCVSSIVTPHHTPNAAPIARSARSIQASSEGLKLSTTGDAEDTEEEILSVNLSPLCPPCWRV